MTGGRSTSSSEVSSGVKASSRSSSAVRAWTTSSSTPNSRASIVAVSSSRLALMVTICPMPFIILRMRSVARTPIASERLRTLIGGSIWA